MPNNKNILREKINEACPELLKLEFGCVYKEKENNGEWKEYTIVHRNDIYDKFGAGKNEVWSVPDFNKGYHADWRFENNDNIEILGKPPTLEHLLRTLKEVKDLYSIDSFGQIYKHTEGGEYATGFIYDLTKPPLEQSEEVIEALLKIINA